MARWHERLVPREERWPVALFVCAALFWLGLSQLARTPQTEFYRQVTVALCTGWVIGSLGLFAATGVFLRLWPQNTHVKQHLRDIGLLLLVCVLIPVAAAMRVLPQPLGILASAGVGFYWACCRMGRVE